MGRIYKRNDIWYLDVQYGGRRIRRRVGTSKKVAELALKDAEVKIAKEEFGLSRPKDVKLAGLFAQFLEYSGTNHRVSTTRRYRTVIDHFTRFLKDKHPKLSYLSQLNAAVGEGYKSWRRTAWVNPNGQRVKSDDDVQDYTRKGARARTVNLEVEAIKIILNMAIKWGYLKENPLKPVKFLKEDDRKAMRYLTKEECQRLLDASPSDLRPVFFTFLHTGMRKGELEHLTWADIDFDRRKIYIRSKDGWNPKTGAREIPIGTALYDVLQELHAAARPAVRSAARKASDSDYVFKAKDSGHSHNRLRRELIKIAAAAEIPDLTKLHTLRHTFASHLVMSGVDLPTVKKLMGHSDIQTTMIYAHLAPDHLAEAVDKLEF